MHVPISYCFSLSMSMMLPQTGALVLIVSPNFSCIHMVFIWFNYVKCIMLTNVSDQLSLIKRNFLEIISNLEWVLRIRAQISAYVDSALQRF